MNDPYFSADDLLTRITVTGGAIHHAPNRPNLSEEARALLKQASQDPAGHIWNMQGIGERVGIQTNSKPFGRGATPREAQQWKSALRELEVNGLISDLTHKGEMYEVTQEGYSVADQISG